MFVFKICDPSRQRKKKVTRQFTEHAHSIFLMPFQVLILKASFRELRGWIITHWPVWALTAASVSGT